MPHFNTFVFIIAILLAGQVSAQTDQANIYYQQGVTNNQQGLLIEASVLFTQAIAEYPEFAQAYYQRGLSFDGMGEKSHAIKDFKQSVDYKIVNLQPYLRLINHYKSNSQYLAALIITDQLVANMPDQAAGGYYDKGQIYELMNKSSLAIKAYEMTLKNTDEDMTIFKEQLLDKIAHLKYHENKQ